MNYKLGKRNFISKRDESNTGHSWPKIRSKPFIENYNIAKNNFGKLNINSDFSWMSTPNNNIYYAYSTHKSHYNVVFSFNDLKIKETTIEEALKTANGAYCFARDRALSKEDFAKCQEVACKDLYYVKMFARLPNADFKYCQEVACKSVDSAISFAKEVARADVEYCFSKAAKLLIMERACK